jgi:hypothetical protein
MQNQSDKVCSPEIRILGERIAEILHLPAGIEMVNELWKISPQSLDLSCCD